MKKFLHCSGISVAEVRVQVKKVGFRARAKAGEGRLGDNSFRS